MKRIPDKLEFIGEVWGWLEENDGLSDDAPAEPLDYARGKLQNVDVQGNTAKGEVVLGDGHGGHSPKGPSLTG